MVMELLPESLSQCLERHRQIPGYMKTSILYDISLGLLHMHKQTPPIVHCNLTANSILLTSNMRAKVAGLTVAQFLHTKCLKLTDDMSSWLRSFTTMPPEIISARPEYDEKLDVFSFGILVHYVCTQQWPDSAPPLINDPQNPSVPKILTEVQRRQKYFDMIDKKNPLRAIAESCLQNLPSQRPSTATIVSQLEQIYDSDSFPQGVYLEILLDYLTLKEKERELTNDLLQLRQQIVMLTKKAGQEDATIAHLGEDKLSAPLPIAEVRNVIVLASTFLVYLLSNIIGSVCMEIAMLL